MENEVLALPAECWRWVTGFEGLYQVSTRGRVRSVDRWIIGKDGKKQFYEGRILKPFRDKGGYLTVTLCRNGKPRAFRVHRMVLEVWGDGNPENKPQAHHRDENKENCAVENLSWASAKENANFGTRNKRIAGSMLNGKLSKAVEAIDPSTGEVVLEFPSAKEAERNGFDSGHISKCCLGKKWCKTHRGYIWRYKP